MWFKFAPNEGSISIERMMFATEWTNAEGENFFRAPEHFREKLVKEGGCQVITGNPPGVPNNLPEITFQENQKDSSDEMLAIKQELSMEKSASSSLRAELGSTMHERDQLKLQVHELTEKVLELETKIEDEGLDDEK